MAFRKKRTATFYDKEILKYFTGSEVTRNVVIDGTTVTVGADGRYILEAGTVLRTLGGASALAYAGKVRPAPATAMTAAEVVGILTHTIEFYYPPEAGVTDEPAAAYFEFAHFDTTKLLGMGDATQQAAIVSALPLCRFSHAHIG